MTVGRSTVETLHQMKNPRPVAFLMVALSQVRVPDAPEPLFAKSFERAQVVNGLYEFTLAAANYPRTLKVLEQRVVNAIIAELAPAEFAARQASVRRTLL